MTALRPVIVVRSSIQNPATFPCDKRLLQCLSTASPVRAPSGRNRFHCRRTKTVGLRPTVLVRCLMAGMAGRRSGRNGCFGAAAAGVLHGARTIPTVAGRSMRALSRLADVAGFWTLDRTTITGRSAVILRQHTTPFRPMIVPLMIWSLSSAPDGVDLQEGVVHATRRTYVPTGLSDPGIVVRTGGWRTCVNTSLNRKLAGRIRPNAARVKCCDPTSTAG